MRYLKPFLLIAVISVFLGFGPKGKTFTKGISPGDLAPEIQLQGVDLSKDKYVLLQFWAAYDGESRKQNALLNNKISQSELDNLQIISISFDEKKSVFEQAVKADKLNASNQFNIETGKTSEIYKNYRLKNGFGNLLINPDGIIVARNLSPDQVIRMLTTKGA
ncbi:MAG: thioredoxin family protein [Dysgonamonadaceae bacterium]|jgi:hypothetical protein|nr:thioredoxin family protein [Dysgonamonadaceae bacterium]